MGDNKNQNPSNTNTTPASAPSDAVEKIIKSGVDTVEKAIHKGMENLPSSKKGK